MGLGLRARGQEWRLGARAVARAEIYGSGVGLGLGLGTETGG